MALSGDTAATSAIVAQPSAIARRHALESTQVIGRSPTRGAIPSGAGVADIFDAGGTRHADVGVHVIAQRLVVQVAGVLLPDSSAPTWPAALPASAKTAEIICAEALVPP